jgi:pyrophosphate--fructose-6-phosphate 1-phosphotransferase
MSTSKKKVAILTAGGHAPCLSAAVGQLILPLYAAVP